MTLVPVHHSGGDAFLRADTCEALGIRAHDVLDAELWQTACWQDYQRNRGRQP